MFSIVFRLEIEPSPSVHPNPIKILPFGNISEIIVEKNEIGRGKYIYNLITKRGRGSHCTEVRFAIYFSSGFIIAIEVNPLERKLAKPTALGCFGSYANIGSPT